MEAMTFPQNMHSPEHRACGCRHLSALEGRQEGLPLQGIQGRQSVSAGQQAHEVGAQEVPGLMQGHAVPVAAADHPACCVDQQGFQSPAVGYLQASHNSLLTLLVKSIGTSGLNIPHEPHLRPWGSVRTVMCLPEMEARPVPDQP